MRSAEQRIFEALMALREQEPDGEPMFVISNNPGTAQHGFERAQLRTERAGDVVMVRREGAV